MPPVSSVLWPSLNGRMLTFRCRWLQKQSGVYFFHPRPSIDRCEVCLKAHTHRGANDRHHHDHGHGHMLTIMMIIVSQYDQNITVDLQMIFLTMVHDGHAGHDGGAHWSS